MKTKEMPLSPSLLLEMDEARLHALKSAMKYFVAEFQRLIGMMEQDIEATRNLKRKLQKREDKREEDEEGEEHGVFCIKIGPREHEHEHCRCGRKKHGRRHAGRNV